MDPNRKAHFSYHEATPEEILMHTGVLPGLVPYWPRIIPLQDGRTKGRDVNSTG